MHTGPDAIPHSPEALYNDLKARLEQATTGIDLQVPLAPFTALTPHARLTVCAVQARNAMEAMERIGRKLIMFRSNGRRVAGVAQRVAYTLNKTQEFSGTRFDLDKRRVIAWMSGAKSPDRPDRAIWGLPHNYSFSDARPTAVELNPSAPPLWGLPPGAAPGFGRQVPNMQGI